MTSGKGGLRGTEHPTDGRVGGTPRRTAHLWVVPSIALARFDVTLPP